MEADALHGALAGFFLSRLDVLVAWHGRSRRLFHNPDGIMSNVRGFRASTLVMAPTLPCDNLPSGAGGLTGASLRRACPTLSRTPLWYLTAYRAAVREWSAQPDTLSQQGEQIEGRRAERRSRTAGRVPLDCSPSERRRASRCLPDRLAGKEGTRRTRRLSAGGLAYGSLAADLIECSWNQYQGSLTPCDVDIFRDPNLKAAVHHRSPVHHRTPLNGNIQNERLLHFCPVHSNYGTFGAFRTFAY